MIVSNMSRRYQTREEIESTVRNCLDDIGQTLHRYPMNELLELRDTLQSRMREPQQHHHSSRVPSFNAVNRRSPFVGSNYVYNSFSNGMIPPNSLLNGMNLTNSINNRDVGFEMVTTVSATSPGDLPDSLLNAIQNIIGDVALETLESQGGAAMMGNWTGEDVHVALPIEYIRKMPSKRYKCDENSEPQECTICFENFERNERYRELPCKHLFHKRCVDKWFDKSVFCPMCRQDMRELFSQQPSR